MRVLREASVPRGSAQISATHQPTLKETNTDKRLFADKLAHYAGCTLKHFLQLAASNDDFFAVGRRGPGQLVRPGAVDRYQAILRWLLLV